MNDHPENFARGLGRWVTDSREVLCTIGKPISIASSLKLGRFSTSGKKDFCRTSLAFRQLGRFLVLVSDIERFSRLRRRVAAIPVCLPCRSAMLLCTLRDTVRRRPWSIIESGIASDQEMTARNVGIGSIRAERFTAMTTEPATIANVPMPTPA